MNYTLNKRCEAHVTLKKGRVKEYGSNRAVYLKDGEEFELELFNPHQKSVLAKITINGISLSGGGIVLRPGQRVYLERYLDVDRKFKFSTYEVENSRETVEAIARNGNIEVLFCYEQEPASWYGGSTITIGNSYPWNQQLYYNSSGNPSNIRTFTTNNAQIGGSLSNGTIKLDNSSYSTSNSFYCNVSNTADFNVADFNMKNSFHDQAATYKEQAAKAAYKEQAVKSLETGRVEQGGKSDQEFSTVYDSFNNWSSESITMKILPWSQKPVEVSEIRNYCTSCKTRIKKSSWKFCPTCGADLNS